LLVKRRFARQRTTASPFGLVSRLTLERVRVFYRTGRRTGVSMPFWLALIVGAVWLVVMLAVLLYGLIAAALIFVGRQGYSYWRRRHPA
jgi:hypothetical protein